MDEEFSLSAFYKEGLLEAVESGEVPTHQIVNRATEKYMEGLLTELDLMEVHKALKQKKEARHELLS